MLSVIALQLIHTLNTIYVQSLIQNQLKHVSLHEGMGARSLHGLKARS